MCRTCGAVKKNERMPFGGSLASKRIGVLGVARSVCAFSAASGGLDKYSGAAKLQKALVAVGCSVLVPLGGAEVEMEEVDVAVLPWVDGVAAALALAASQGKREMSYVPTSEPTVTRVRADSAASPVAPVAGASGAGGRIPIDAYIKTKMRASKSEAVVQAAERPPSVRESSGLQFAAYGNKVRAALVVVVLAAAAGSMLVLSRQRAPSRR
mmetsp:Transcript_45093/g.118237  ORF Transcript_45093/g.118237 Transcript_45093/m.118237 type:complete len:211 (-) Transcript_45093:204-836(-)